VRGYLDRDAVMQPMPAARWRGRFVTHHNTPLTCKLLCGCPGAILNADGGGLRENLRDHRHFRTEGISGAATPSFTMMEFTGVPDYQQLMAMTEEWFSTIDRKVTEAIRSVRHRTHFDAPPFAGCALREAPPQRHQTALDRQMTPRPSSTI